MPTESMACEIVSAWELLVVEAGKFETRLGKAKIQFGTFYSFCRLSWGGYISGDCKLGPKTQQTFWL